jgi:hypothetical protein
MGYGHKHLWLSLTFLTVAAAAFYVASRIMSGNYAFLSVMTGLLALYPFLICLISWIAQLGSEKRHAEIKSHIDNLIQSLGGGAVQHVDQQTLKRLYKKRDFPAMLGWIKQSMRLNLRVGLRIVDHRAKTPMWIEWTNTMPLVGTAEFRDKRVIINATREILGKPFDWIVAGFAHELAHVVLCSINHKLQEDEKAVDLTAMILGYDKFMMKADYTTTEWVGFNTTRQKTEWLGYLTIPERQFAGTYIRKLRRKKLKSEKLQARFAQGEANRANA